MTAVKDKRIRFFMRLGSFYLKLPQNKEMVNSRDVICSASGSHGGEGEYLLDDNFGHLRKWDEQIVDCAVLDVSYSNQKQNL